MFGRQRGSPPAYLARIAVDLDVNLARVHRRSNFREVHSRGVGVHLADYRAWRRWTEGNIVPRKSQTGRSKSGEGCCSWRWGRGLENCWPGRALDVRAGYRVQGTRSMGGTPSINTASLTCRRCHVLSVVSVLSVLSVLSVVSVLSVLSVVSVLSILSVVSVLSVLSIVLVLSVLSVYLEAGKEL